MNHNHNTHSEHDHIFEEEADHDNVSAMLDELIEYPSAFNAVKSGMRLDLTDKELLDLLKEKVGKSELSGKNLDNDWDDFKGNFGEDGNETEDRNNK